MNGCEARSAPDCIAERLGVQRLRGEGNTGLFLVRTGEVQAFFDRHPWLQSAPLNVVSSSIRDTASSGNLVNCAPAPHVFAKPTSAKRRRVSDVNSLTPAGEVARRITARPKSGVWSGTIVWKFRLCCKGTGRCDPRPGGSTNGCMCQLTVQCTATIDQVHSGHVQIEVSGQHSITKQWDPKLTNAISVQTSRDITTASTAVGTLKAELNQLAAQERPQTTSRTASSCPSIHVAVTASASVNERLRVAEREEERLRAESRPYHSLALRDEIERLYAEGQQGATTLRAVLYSRAQRENGEAIALEMVPTVAYIQGVLDNRRRMNRSRQPPYEAVDELNRTVLADERICITYQHFDARAAEDTEGEITLSVYTTMELLDHAMDVNVACLDAKWCTRSDGGCVIGLIGVHRCSTPKPGADPGWIPEYMCGYCHHFSDAILVAHSNRDNFWSVKLMLESVGRMMKCSNPECLHPVVKRDRADGRGFVLVREECARSGLQKEFKPTVMIGTACEQNIFHSTLNCHHLTAVIYIA